MFASEQVEHYRCEGYVVYPEFPIPRYENRVSSLYDLQERSRKAETR